jgi:hypothetical protein
VWRGLSGRAFIKAREQEDEKKGNYFFIVYIY